MKIKNDLNSQKMKHCNQKTAWSALKNNWLKDNLKVFCYSYLLLKIDRTSRVNYKTYDEKCYDQWHLSILSNTYNYWKQ